MKKLISVVAALALVGSIAAAPKKPAKPAAKPAVAVPAVPAVPAIPKSTSPTGGAKFIIAPWGGYNIGQKTDLVTASEANYLSAVTQSVSNDTKAQGIAGGLDLWYGEKFQFGLGAYYQQGTKTTKTTSFTAAQSGSVAGTTTQVVQMNYLPILAQVRFFVFEGFYVGAGAGVAVLISSKIEGSSTFTQAQLNSTLLPFSTDVTGTAIWLQGKVGYQFDLSDMLALNVFANFSYQIQTVSYKDISSNGTATSAVASDVKNTGYNITPGLAIAFKF